MGSCTGRGQYTPFGACQEDLKTGMALQEATTLSRAVKEHGRRRGQKEGFSIAPGDCLAFKYYRDVSRPSLTPSVWQTVTASGNRMALFFTTASA